MANQSGWINFNGTGTIAIVDSDNVTSITDEGTGDYTITWNVDFSSAYYGLGGMCQRVNIADTGVTPNVSVKNATAPLVGSVRIMTALAESVHDCQVVMVIATT